MQSLLRDLGWEAEVRVWTDSSTAKGVAARRGLGKMRHVELRFLWVQEKVRGGKIRLHKVPGLVNVADHLTKGKMWWEFEGLLRNIGGMVRPRAGDGVVRRRESWDGEKVEGSGGWRMTGIVSGVSKECQEFWSDREVTVGGLGHAGRSVGWAREGRSEGRRVRIEEGSVVSGDRSSGVGSGGGRGAKPGRQG